jgi:hypothetical protein
MIALDLQGDLLGIESFGTTRAEQREREQHERIDEFTRGGARHGPSVTYPTKS